MIVNLNRVKAERVAAGLTQEQLAKKIGIARNTYQSYEAGDRAMSADILGKIAEVLDIDPKHIYIFFTFGVDNRGQKKSKSRI